MTKISIFALLGAVATASLTVSAAPINLGESNVQLTERNYEANGEWSYENMARRELDERSAWDPLEESEGELYARADKPKTTTTSSSAKPTATKSAEQKKKEHEKAEHKKAEHKKKLAEKKAAEKKAEDAKKHKHATSTHKPTSTKAASKAKATSAPKHKVHKFRHHWSHSKTKAADIRKNRKVEKTTAAVNGVCKGGAIRIRHDKDGKNAPAQCCATKVVVDGVCYSAGKDGKPMLIKTNAYRKKVLANGVKKHRQGKDKKKAAAKPANKAAAKPANKAAAKPLSPAAKKVADNNKKMAELNAKIAKLEAQRKADIKAVKDAKAALKKAKTSDEKKKLKQTIKDGKKKAHQAKKDLKKLSSDKKKQDKQAKKDQKAADKEAKKDTSKPSLPVKMANKLAGKKNGAVSDLVGAAGFKPIATAAFAVAVAAAML